MSTAQPEPRVSSDEEGPGRKRLRVSRACGTCRRRKERCDGVRPTCGRCVSTGAACSYLPSRKRGLRTGYVRGMEILLGLLISAYNGSEDLVSSALNGRNPQQPPPQTTRPTSSLLESWRQSAAREELQRTLASGDDEDEELYLQGLNGKLTTAFNSFYEDGNVGSVIDVGDDDEPATETQISAEVEAPVLLHTPRPTVLTGDDPSASVQTTSHSLTLPLNWSRLIDVYLSSTHSWLPIIPKVVLFRSANFLANPELSVGENSPSSGDVATLWAVLSFSSCQLEGWPSSQGAGPVGAQLPPSHLPVQARQLHETTKAFALQVPSNYETGHISASLILALQDISLGHWTESWLWVGRAVYLAASLQIIPPKGIETMSSLNDCHKLLFLGCFILDTLIASALNFRPYLRRANLRHVGEISTDGLDEWESWRPSDRSLIDSSGPARILSSFNRFGYLAGLLNDICWMREGLEHQHSSRELLNEFMTWQETMFTLSSTPSDTPHPIEIQGRPHFLQLNVAASTVFVLLKSLIANSTPTQSISKVNNVALSHALRRTLNSMTVTSKHDHIPNLVRTLPTLRVFSVILDNHKASSPNFLLRWNFTNSGVSIPADTRDVNVSRQVHDSATSPDCTDTLVLTPPNLSSRHSSGHETLTNLDFDGQTSPDAVVMPEGADPDSIFNQLSLLDTGNWSFISSDFMKNLGMSRDELSLDGHNLLP